MSEPPSQPEPGQHTSSEAEQAAQPGQEQAPPAPTVGNGAGPTGTRTEIKRKIEIVSQIPHAKAICDVTFSPDGTRVLSGSADKTLKMWDAATGQLMRTFVHLGPVCSVAFSPDGKRVLTGSGKTMSDAARQELTGTGSPDSLRLWDAATGRLVQTFPAGGVGFVAFSPDGARVLSSGGGLKLWDVASGQLVHTYSGIPPVAFSPDGTRMLSGGSDHALKLWDLSTGQLVHTFPVHSDSVFSVAFSADGTRILSGSGDNTIRIWDLGTGQLVRTFEGHWGPAIASSRDGTLVLSASKDKAFKLWDAATGQLVHTFPGDGEEVGLVAISPDGKRVVLGTRYSNEEETELAITGQIERPAKTLKLWDVATGQLVHTFAAVHSGPVYSVAFSPDGSRVLSGSDGQGGGALKLWELAAGQLARTFAVGDGKLVNKVAFSPDGTRVLSEETARAGDTLKLWDLGTGQVVRTFPANWTLFGSVAFSPDGARVLSGGEDGTLKLWDATTGQPVHSFGEHIAALYSVAFSSDSTQVLAGRGGVGEHRIDLWDAATGRLVRTFEDKKALSGSVYSVAFSPDGNHVLSGSFDGNVRLWDVATGAVGRTFAGHSGAVTSVAFSADGAHVLSGSVDDTLKLWDAASGQLVHTLEGHSDEVYSVAFSPSGREVLSGSKDSTIRLWRTDTGEALATLVASDDGEWLVLTPEGFFNASSPAAGKLLSIVRGLEIFGIDQAWQALYRPDLVKEKLAGDPSGKVRDAAAKLDLAKILDSGAVPSVAIKSHKATDTSAADLVTVIADIADQGGGIGKVEWRVNGITVGASDAAVQKGSAGRHLDQSQEIALDPGDNLIEVVAYNAAGLVASVPAKTTIKWTGTEPTAKPHLHILAVGVNDYDEVKKLNFGVPDATALADGLSLKEASQDLYDGVSVTKVLDKEATAQHLEEVFADLKSTIRPRDVFIFYAAGHGVTDDGRYYFIPQDFKYQVSEPFAKNLAERAIGQEQLQRWFAMIPARKSIVMFDTCESGSLTSLPGELQVALNTRGGLEQLAAVGRLIQATGRTTLTAAMDDQSALEGYRGHGVFTFALLEALAHADSNGNGLVEVTELLEYIDTRVPEITDKTWHVRQIPRFLLQGSNFPLVSQVRSLEPAPGEETIISTTPTHVVSELVEVLKSADSSGAVVEKLEPFTTVTLVKTEHGWALIAKDGKSLGYVMADKLHALH